MEFLNFLHFILQVIAITLLLLFYISWWHISGEWDKHLENLNVFKYAQEVKHFVKSNSVFVLLLTLSIIPIFFYYAILRDSWLVTHNWWLSPNNTVTAGAPLWVWHLAVSDRLQLTFLLDELAILFSLMTVLVVSLILSVCWFFQLIKKELLCFILVSIEYSLLGVFASHDFLSFFFFFEMTLLPMFVLIFSYGTGLNKLKAAYWLVVFTLLSSVCLMLAISIVFVKTGLINFSEVYRYFNQGLVTEDPLSFFLCGMFFLSFSIKVPLMPLHIWLPEVHVEAPTIGSMVLASLLLKLGGYGILRICCGVFPQAFQELTLYIVPILLLSFVLSGLIAIIQVDAKKVIAYSSIAHMSTSLLGVCYLIQYGFVGAVISMVAHAFTSPALFFLVGVLYERYHTRNTLYFGGLSRVMPLFTVFFFIYILSNTAFPGFMNFIGEINIFLGLATLTFFPLFFLYVVFLLGVLIITAYSLTLFNRICWGNVNWYYLKKTSDLTFLESTLLGCFLLLLLFFGFEPDILLVLSEVPRSFLSR